IRRRKNLDPGGTYQERFARYTHESWKNRHDWEHKYVNELFVTVVRDGETGSIRTPTRFQRGFFPEKDNRQRMDNLRRMHGELNAVTDRMLASLDGYGAIRMALYERDGVYYSQPLRFLGKILKLREEEVPVSYTA